MLLLVLSIVTLFAGPLLAWLARRSAAIMAGIDGYILVAMVTLAVTELLPYAYNAAGWPVLLFAALGLTIPTLAERSLMAPERFHRWVLGLGLLGIAFHATLDGVPLGTHEHGHDAHDDEPMGSLAMAVVLHRLPMGLLVWWAVAPIAGLRGVLWLLGLISGCTLLGAFLGPTMIDALPSQGLAYFVALLTGALLHIVAHGIHPPSGEGDESHEDHHHVLERCVEGPAWAGAIGGALGLATLVFLSHAHPSLSATGEKHTASDTFMTLAYESAPALLLALVAAGLLRSFISPASLGWMGRGGRAGQAGRGMVFGLPLPICSCGVLPLYEGLIRAGAPPTAAAAFLIATPELGIDAVLLSLPLLGSDLTMARVVCAALVAFGVAVLVAHRFRTPTPTPTPAEFEVPGSRTGASRLKSGLRFGLVELVDHTMPWIILGLGLAALLEPLLNMNQLASLPAWIQVPVFAVLGIPVYVCAAGATPLVAILLHKGLSAGAAIAFLLTGPATNITTFGILRSLHGRSSAIRFGIMVAVFATALGWLVNLWSPSDAGALLAHEASHDPSLLQQVCLSALCLLVAASIWRQGPRGVLSQILSPAAHDHSHEHGHSHCHHDDHHGHDDHHHHSDDHHGH